MRQNRLRYRLLALAAALAAAAVTAALAVPVITVKLQQLGVGVSVVTSPVGSVVVLHQFSIGSTGIVLDKASLIFDSDLPAGTYIRIELRDVNENVLTSAETTLTQDLAAGTPLTLDLTPDLDIYTLMNYDHTVIVVAGPQPQ